jgi:hypothetical protein
MLSVSAPRYTALVTALHLRSGSYRAMVAVLDGESERPGEPLLVMPGPATWLYKEDALLEGELVAKERFSDAGIEQADIQLKIEE